ncbi:MAG: hypothetical protein H6624_14935 [Bdellovibrionaceae bacterium]|nr:hypothetical protein [Bdellovibrionales bacterium]MCB9085639.1 hypothetical protein [Pseudobdellovibrionaceae bacterium]
MGEEISHSQFSEDERSEFQKRLREETKLLMGLFQNHAFSDENDIVGFEIEAWLTNENFIPMPENQKFLDQLNNPLVVHELSQFNFELNGYPQKLDGAPFSKMEQSLDQTWNQCRNQAQWMNGRALRVGILPTLRDEMLKMEYASKLERYKALNEQVLAARGGRPIHLRIEGYDEVQSVHHDVMLEAAATSLQIHLQIPQNLAGRYYNAGVICAAPMVALAANSPYLFGRELWDETRIPLFEQSIFINSFQDVHGENISRVTLGTGYVRESLFELFLENLDGYPPLLPMVLTSEPERLGHLRLHNGTLWRWNRPLIGISDQGEYHLRIEHRVTAAGPSLRDEVAHVALFKGLSDYMVEMEEPPELKLDFQTARENFYDCCKMGLQAEITWIDGQRWNVQKLFHEWLLPKAAEALSKKGVSSQELQVYFEQTLKPRVLSGQNGAAWQKAYIATHGPDFQGMTEAYFQNQESGRPVHEWSV